ncbi:MAG: U32 family peptidase [Deltaproteobacteria bacterium]|nr:MAG: U32 family peptidase [Deltaproteobacteria bacterium]
MSREFELSTDLFSLEDLQQTDRSLYDAFYLGNPLCHLYRGNLMTEESDLFAAVEILRGEGKKIYLTTPAAPRMKEIPVVEKALDLAVRAKVDGVEVNNLGVLTLMKERGISIPAHTGPFANVYTDVSARYLSTWGVVRVRPNPEVSYKECVDIRENGGVDVTVVLHGKIPLGVVPDCFFTEEKGEEVCPEACLEPAWLTRGEWVIRHVGKGVSSGLDFCLYEHLDRVVEGGFSFFRIEGGYETPEYRNRVGKIYRDSLEALLAGRWVPSESRLEELRSLARYGLCNGYFFGTTGRKYFDRAAAGGV